MKSKGKFKFNIVWRIWIPYVMILVFALLIGLIVHARTVTVVEREIQKSNMNLLKQSMNTIDMRIDEVNARVRLLYDDPLVNQFREIEQPYKGANTYKLIKLRRYIYEHNMSNHFIFDYYIIFKKSNVVVGPYLTENLQTFYKDYYSVQNLSYEQWMQQMWHSYHNKDILPAQMSLYAHQPDSIIPYIQSLGYGDQSDAAILVLIKNNVIQELLKGIDVSSEGWVYIADNDGHIISSFSGDQSTKPSIIPLPLDSKSGVLQRKVGAQNMLVTYITSDFNQWTYVAVQPKQHVLEKVDFINRITITIILSTLVIGTAAAFVLAYRNSNPIRRLLATIFERMDEVHLSKDAFGTIHGTLSKLLDLNEEQKARLNEQIPYMKNAFFERLLKGEFHTEQDIQDMIQHIGLHIHGHGYLAVLLHLKVMDNIAGRTSLKQWDITRVIAEEVIREKFPDNSLLHIVDENKIAVIVAGPFKDMQQTENRMQELFVKVRDHLYDAYQIHSVFSAGTVRSSLKDISRSYDEARQALYYLQWKPDQTIIWFNKLPKEHCSYFYPSDLEMKLINLVKSGESEQTQQLLSELFEENMVRGNLSLTTKKIFIMDLTGTLMKLADLLSIRLSEADELYQLLNMNMETKEELDHFFAVLKEQYQAVCNKVNDENKNANHHLLQMVIQYIEDYYTDPNLSLTSVGNHFHLSEAHLSRSIKEITGENFSDYLLSLRMNLVRSLLKNTDIPISKIVKKAGYHSLNTFGRAFKRIHGVSASVYRNRER